MVRRAYYEAVYLYIENNKHEKMEKRGNSW